MVGGSKSGGGGGRKKMVKIPEGVKNDKETEN